MSLKFLTIATMLAFLASGLMVIPTTGAQAAATNVKAGDPIMEVYVAGDKLGEPMVTTAPTGTTSKKATILVGTVINPAVGTGRTVVGSITPAADLSFVADYSVNLWLVSNQATVFDQIQANLYQGGTAVISGNTRLPGPVQLGTTPSLVRIGIDAMGKSLKGATKYTLELVLFGAGAAGTPTDAFLLWGSATHPSGITGAVSTAAAFASTNSAFPVFLADKALTITPPTDAADKKSPAPTSGCTGPCAGSSASVTWGKTSIPAALKVTGETVLTLYLGVTGSGGVVRGFSASMNLGGTTYSSGLGTFASTWTAATTVNKYVFTFATRGAEVEAGKDISFAFQLWSSTDTPAGQIQFLFGSVGRPAGFTIPVSGGGSAPAAGPALPSILVSSDEADLSGPAGASVAGTLSLANEGPSAADIELTANGNATVAFPDGASVTVGAGDTSLVNFTVSVPNQPAGTIIPFVIHAKVDGVEVGNVSFTLVVEPAAAPSASPTSSSAASTEAPASAAARTQENIVVTPGLPLVAVLASLAALGAIRRRRESAR